MFSHFKAASHVAFNIVQVTLEAGPFIKPDTQDFLIVTEAPLKTLFTPRTEDFIPFDEKCFRQFIVRPVSRLMLFSERVADGSLNIKDYNWPLLGALSTEAEKVEEYLDIFGAAGNSKWYLVRELTACVKNFADIAYRFHQVHNCFSRFESLQADTQLAVTIDDGLETLCDIIHRSMTAFHIEIHKIGLAPLPEIARNFKVFDEEMPHGVLPHDHRISSQTGAETRAGALATQFLNLAVDSGILAQVKRSDETSFKSLFPHQINEESLRHMEYNFHNLQSLYDTYISSTKEENVDDELRELRAHISVILRLLEAGTLLGHFYERHQSLWREEKRIEPVVDFPAVLALLRATLVATHSHVEASKQICHGILRKYTKKGEVRVPIPKYRGFHVRPSALVMKIVTHYGTDVKMSLGNAEYNAASALDMMRANEWVNALKRREVSEIVAKQSLEKPALNDWDLHRKVSRAIHQLAENNSIVVYDRPLDIGELTFSKDTPVGVSVQETLKRLLFTGKIDVEMDIMATFIGDERPLRDIQILAENHYCEDSFGNNIPLPPDLPYLRR